MIKTVLEVQNLKTYFFTRRGVVKAVDGVSFSVKEGETLGLVGESGCGKTLTCLSIVRLVPEPAGRIVDGKILFEGENLLEKSEEAIRRYRGRKISMILQDPMTSLNPAFSIGNQVAEAIGAHRRLDKKSLWHKTEEVLRSVRIPSPEVRMRDYPHQMSGGMRQRVVGGMAIACQPSLLIADEATTSLDVTTQAYYLRLLKEIQQAAHISMIFITHNFGIVAKICDHVAVMYSGKIVESAEVRELFKNPLHPYTIALMKSLPKLTERVERLFSIKGQPPSPHDLPRGCRFYPRCDEALDICANEYPPIVQVRDDHYTSCWARQGSSCDSNPA